MFMILEPMKLIVHTCTQMGLPGGSVSKESTCDAGDWGSISGSGKFSGVGNGNQLQYSCLGNSMERGAWQAAAHGIAKNQI